MKKRAVYKQKRLWIPITIITLLIGLRIALPYLVKNYVNKTLSNIPDYYGQVEDINISLIRGAYSIENLYLNKVNAKTEVPFLDFKHTDISIQWKSLFKGKIVSEIEMTQPTIIYVFEDQQQPANGEETEVEDWSIALTDLVPIDINRLQITNGKLAFVEVSTTPTIDLQMNDLNLELTNLRNVVNEREKLPSKLKASATSIGKGKVSLNGELNVVKQIPDMDISFSLEEAQVTSLNDFTKHYAGIDFSSGTFGLYSEMAINDGNLKGYAKPILTKTKLISEDDKFSDKLWEGFVGFFKFVFKNQKQDTLATKVEFQGNLNNVQTKIIPTITNLLKNAWIKAYKGVTDDTIEFEDANTENKKKKKESDKENKNDIKK